MSMVDLLFSFKGRIGRSQYWLGALGVGFTGALALAVLTSVLGSAGGKGATDFSLLSILSLPLSGLMTWCGLAVQVKRFHDRGQSGFWTLLPLVPVLGMIDAIANGIINNVSIVVIVGQVMPYLLALVAINFGFLINLGFLAGAQGANKYDNDPQPPKKRDDGAPSTSPSSAPSLGAAELAIERAIAAQARGGPVPAPAGGGTGGGFGRRVAR